MLKTLHSAKDGPVQIMIPVGEWEFKQNIGAALIRGEEGRKTKEIAIPIKEFQLLLTRNLVDRMDSYIYICIYIGIYI